MSFTEISKCRICGNTSLVTILDLGEQALTGVFPKKPSDHVSVGPLQLVKCHNEDGDKENCGLVQLRHSFVASEMYGDNYGYRSGLNQSMVRHLHSKVARLRSLVKFSPGDYVIDIGSNDGTSLAAYCDLPESVTLVGCDPTANKFRQYYNPRIKVVADFFTAANIRKEFGDQARARVVSSIAMLYDLEEPLAFFRDVHNVLADDGIWVFEMSYMPTMLEVNAYDTVCHEHLEYYGLKQIKYMTDRTGFKIVDVELNNINGGSFSVIVAKQSSTVHPEATELIQKMLGRELAELKLHTLTPYAEFDGRVRKHRDELNALLQRLKAQGEVVFGAGASTKGNVVLQYCGLSAENLPAISEVNPDKFGAFTPGTLIPIISEKEARERKPHYMMVLPWHFRDTLIEREAEYLKSGGKLIFPLPNIEIVAQDGSTTVTKI